MKSAVPSTVKCTKCNRELELYPIGNYTPPPADGADFVCANCGQQIAQLFRCSKCDMVNIVDLTSPHIRPGRCTCGETAIITKKIEFPLTS
jgi:hypothetical protein